MTTINGRNGICCVADLKARCKVNPITHCWEWQGATDGRTGHPVVYALDYGRVEKRAMSGPLAAWNLAHEAAPMRGWLVMRCCGNRLCLNPAHLREVRSKVEMGKLIRLSGRRAGKCPPGTLDSLRKAREASGVLDTPDDVVRAIRAADKSMTGRQLAALHGISEQVVSRIRRGESRAGVV